MFFPTETMKKEYFPYDYYTKDRYLEEIGNIKEALIYVKDATLEQFITSIKNADAMIDDDKFDMEKYAVYYCEIDVDILRKSLVCFRK